MFCPAPLRHFIAQWLYTTFRVDQADTDVLQRGYISQPVRIGALPMYPRR